MTIEEMLDTLAEFQAQKDLLDLDRQALIDAVKIPAEVLEAQRLANMERQRLDSVYFAAQQKIRAQEQELLAEVIDPEIPPEFAEALAAARAKREDIRQQASYRLECEMKASGQAKAKFDADLQAKVADVYNQVALRKSEIIAEFGDKAAAVVANIDKLTAEIKEAVKLEGKSVKGKAFMAVFVKGRVTWITDMLDGMIVAFPALAKARKEGEPSVTIRKV
jgi:hypothetical protein